ncbi:MAG: hypothetical protein MJ236_03800 [Clostridia bacterium]|nr:hypothetical protein [Clostridia bacterium]
MSISELFSKVNSEERNQNEDYKVTFSKASIIIMFVASIVFAIFVWSFAIYTDSAVHMYENVKIEIQNQKEDCTYTLDLNSVSFDVRGRKQIIQGISDGTIVPYIDVESCNPVSYHIPRQYIVPVKFKYDTEKYTFLIYNVSVESLLVTVSYDS